MEYPYFVVCHICVRCIVSVISPKIKPNKYAKPEGLSADDNDDANDNDDTQFTIA